jgi:hypothetical protein
MSLDDSSSLESAVKASLASAVSRYLSKYYEDKESEKDAGSDVESAYSFKNASDPENTAEWDNEKSNTLNDQSNGENGVETHANKNIDDEGTTVPHAQEAAREREKQIAAHRAQRQHEYEPAGHDSRDSPPHGTRFRFTAADTATVASLNLTITTMAIHDGLLRPRGRSSSPLARADLHAQNPRAFDARGEMEAAIGDDARPSGCPWLLWAWMRGTDPRDAGRWADGWAGGPTRRWVGRWCAGRLTAREMVGGGSVGFRPAVADEGSQAEGGNGVEGSPRAFSSRWL